MLSVVAPAKVNLFLGVGALRPDGFHDVTTVLHALDLTDTLEIFPASRLELRCEPGIGVAEHLNIAYRAAVAMGRAFGRPTPFRITVSKRIPREAGLGGGSSDAAATIAALATLWDVDPTDARCQEVAAHLGADVPFFLNGTGAALMGGRGDVLQRVLPGLDGAPVVLVRPDGSVPTRAAYAAFDEAPCEAGNPDAVCAALDDGDVAALAYALRNNLSFASATVVPAVAEAVAWIRVAPGVLGGAVAGSGSAVFGICDSHESARRCAHDARMRGWWAETTRLRAQGVEVTWTGCAR